MSDENSGVGSVKDQVVMIPRFNAPQWVPNPVHTDARGGAQGEITSLPVAVLQDAERRVVGGLQKAMRDSVITTVGVVRVRTENCDGADWLPPKPCATPFMHGDVSSPPPKPKLRFDNAIGAGRSAGNAQLQADTEARQLREAVGLLSTLSPQMAINPHSPVEMAQQIVAHVTETIDTLRADLEAKKARLELIERTDMAQENQRLHDRIFGLERVIDERDESISRLRELLGLARDERTYWMEQSADQAKEVGRLNAFIDQRDDPSGPVETLRTVAGDDVAFVITRGSRG